MATPSPVEIFIIIGVQGHSAAMVKLAVEIPTSLTKGVIASLLPPGCPIGDDSLHAVLV